MGQKPKARGDKTTSDRDAASLDWDALTSGSAPGRLSEKLEAASGPKPPALPMPPDAAKAAPKPDKKPATPDALATAVEASAATSKQTPTPPKLPGGKRPGARAAAANASDAGKAEPGKDAGTPPTLPKPKAPPAPPATAATPLGKADGPAPSQLPAAQPDIAPKPSAGPSLSMGPAAAASIAAAAPPFVKADQAAPGSASRTPKSGYIAPEETSEPPRRRRAKRRAAGPSRERIAANDDVPSIGGLIYALNQKPSNRPFYYAAIASSAWLIVGLVLGYLTLTPQLTGATTLTEALRQAPILSTAASVLGPPLLFWFLAFLVWRSDEMHLRSTAMTEVAVRLAEPDRMAEEQVTALGNAVSRQIGFMNEAVNQAMNRASELEAVVKSEVVALEQSYEENEQRIRGLLQELASERNSLTGTGENFRDTLSTLAKDVPALIERLSDQQSKLAGIISGAGSNLTQLEQSLATQTGRLENTLGDRAQQLQAVFEGYATSIGETLESQSQQIQTVLEDKTGKLGIHLKAHSESVETTLTGYTEVLGTVLEGRSAQLSKLIAEGTEHFGTVVGDSTDRFDKMVNQSGEHFRTMLADHTDGVEQDLQRRMATIEDSIARRTDALQSVFEDYRHALDATMVERTKALDSAFDERLRVFDEAMLRSTEAIENAVGSNATMLTNAMEQHAVALSEGINQKAVELDDTLMSGIDAVRRTSENISRQSLRAIEGLANQADMLQNVSENLLGRITSVTNRFEDQGQSILKSANALESANYKIDKALGARTEDLNATLDRLSGKAGEINEAVAGYSTQLEGQMQDAEKRTRLLTAEMSREATERSRTAMDELARLKTEAMREKDRALDELKGEFAAVTREVTERLGVLSQQFSQTSGEVRAQARRAADDIQADQRRLRDQLESLPSATRETADAMRRALQDQLRALDQLTTLARAHGQSRDVRPARNASPPRALSRPHAAPAKSTGPAGARGATAVPPAGRGSQLSSLTSTLARELSQRGATAHPLSAAANPAAATPAGAQTRIPPGSEGGPWSFGDLLARASLGDDPAESSGGSPLDVNTIAKAIDPNLATVIWDRFRSGQRGFMVRSIYPEPTRALFDETRTRYSDEPAFRANVDQFMQEFEDLLREVDGRDASGKAAQDHVTAETGRVYLFLAHASDRLS
ncbi:MAG: hypothetical protein AAFQ45_02540 [Pseudomonadota bacterium]